MDSPHPSDPSTRAPLDPTSLGRLAPDAPHRPDAESEVGAAEAALAFAVAGATGGQAAATVALRAAVGVYVAALKAQGALPERVLIAAKRVVQAAGVPRFGTAGDAALTAQVVTWCVEAYHPAA